MPCVAVATPSFPASVFGLRDACGSAVTSVCFYRSIGLQIRVVKLDVDFLFLFVFQGETPKQRAEKANDQKLAEYLESCQHYQMIQREDQETAV